MIDFQLEQKHRLYCERSNEPCLVLIRPVVLKNIEIQPFTNDNRQAWTQSDDNNSNVPLDLMR